MGTSFLADNEDEVVRWFMVRIATIVDRGHVQSLESFSARMAEHLGFLRTLKPSPKRHKRLFIMLRALERIVGAQQ